MHTIRRIQNILLFTNHSDHICHIVIKSNVLIIFIILYPITYLFQLF